MKKTEKKILLCFVFIFVILLVFLFLYNKEEFGVGGQGYYVADDGRQVYYNPAIDQAVGNFIYNQLRDPRNSRLQPVYSGTIGRVMDPNMQIDSISHAREVFKDDIANVLQNQSDILSGIMDEQKYRDIMSTPDGRLYLNTIIMKQLNHPDINNLVETKFKAVLPGVSVAMKARKKKILAPRQNEVAKTTRLLEQQEKSQRLRQEVAKTTRLLEEQQQRQRLQQIEVAKMTRLLEQQEKIQQQQRQQQMQQQQMQQQQMQQQQQRQQQMEQQRRRLLQPAIPQQQQQRQQQMQQQQMQQQQQRQQRRRLLQPAIPQQQQQRQQQQEYAPAYEPWPEELREMYKMPKADRQPAVAAEFSRARSPGKLSEGLLAAAMAKGPPGGFRPGAMSGGPTPWKQQPRVAQNGLTGMSDKLANPPRAQRGGRQPADPDRRRRGRGRPH